MYIYIDYVYIYIHIMYIYNMLMGWWGVYRIPKKNNHFYGENNGKPSDFGLVFQTNPDGTWDVSHITGYLKVNCQAKEHIGNVVTPNIDGKWMFMVQNNIISKVSACFI